DELHHRDGLAYAGAAEQAHLTALGERTDEIDDLDAGFQQLGGRRELFEDRRVPVDRHRLVGADRTLFVDRFAEHVHDAPERLWSHWDGDALARVLNLHSTTQALGRAEADRAHHAVAELLLYLERELAALESERVVDGRQLVARELHIDDRADALD